MQLDGLQTGESRADHESITAATRRLANLERSLAIMFKLARDAKGRRAWHVDLPHA
jgi:hypothetical protein